MDKSQKIWVNELYLLKFTVCRLTARVRKLENFVAYSLDNLLSTIEDKIKVLEEKAFALPESNNASPSGSGIVNTNIIPQTEEVKKEEKEETKKEENLSQINHETIVSSPFDDLQAVCSTVKDSDILTLAESLAEFEPIINDAEALTYYNLGGDTDRSVFEIMDYEAAQQLLLGPLVTEAEVLHHQQQHQHQQQLQQHHQQQLQQHQQQLQQQHQQHQQQLQQQQHQQQLQQQHQLQLQQHQQLQQLQQQKSFTLINNTEMVPIAPSANSSGHIVDNHNLMDGIEMIIDFQAPSPSHEVEITECIEEIIPLPTNVVCEQPNVVIANTNDITTKPITVTVNSSVPINPMPVPVVPGLLKQLVSTPKLAVAKPDITKIANCVVPTGKKRVKNGKPKSNPELDPETGLFSCSQCGKQFTTVANLKRHAHTHSEKVFFSCTMCTKKYENESRLNKHKTQKHPTQTSAFYCEFCKLHFDNPFAFTNHRLNVHPGE